MKPPKSDTGPPERWQHDEYVDEETFTAGVKRRRVETQTAIDRYFQRRQLGKGQAENARLRAAGTEYANLAYRAGLSPHSGRGPDWVRVDSHAVDLERKFQALEKIRRTDAAIGPTAANVLWWVCVADHTAASWAKGRNHPSGHGIGLAFLVEALRALAKYWGR